MLGKTSQKRRKTGWWAKKNEEVSFIGIHVMKAWEISTAETFFMGSSQKDCLWSEQ